MEPTDQELLAATAAGDGEAFAIFWRRHTSTVMAFGIHRCASSEDVADLVADTFLAAFRAADRYRPQTSTIARDDAVATGKALRALGFKIRWELIELNPGAGRNEPPTKQTKQTRIVEPSPGMVVLSVLGPNGEGDSVDPFTDTLMVEVMTSREAREQLGH
jgi:DNA-directed RNA polymerase specialized sigma24 family protein